MAGDEPRKGRLNRGGRKPGSKNVVPMQVAEMVQNALQLAGQRLKDGDTDGELQGMTAGEAYLMSMALSQPKSFLSLVAKLMPTKLEGELHVFEGADIDDLVASMLCAISAILESQAQDSDALH